MPSPDLAGYKLYRMITPFEGVYTLIASLNGSTTSYTDNSAYTHSGSNGPWAYYFLKAYDSSNRYSSGSDTARICVHPPGWPKPAVGPSDLPLTTRLLEPYPNPFNPTTTIRYVLAEDASVSIQVFNSQGQEVARVVEGRQNSGYREARFAARDLASGTYILRFTVTDVLGAVTCSQIRRVLLIK